MSLDSILQNYGEIVEIQHPKNNISQSRQRAQFLNLNPTMMTSRINFNEIITHDLKFIKGNCNKFKFILVYFIKKFIKNSKNTNWINLSMIFASFYSSIFLPLNLSFSNINYNQTYYILLEILCTLIFIVRFIAEIKNFRKSLKKHKIYSLKRSLIINMIYKLGVPFCSLLYYFSLTIPFSFIFYKIDLDNRKTNLFFWFLQLLRTTNLNAILQIYSFINKKYFLINHILKIITIYAIFSHINACLFITIGNVSNDFNLSWFAKIPAPNIGYPNEKRISFNESNSCVYIHALYWNYVTMSHIGMGDVTPVNSSEKTYTTMIMIISTFLYIFFYGNLASLVEDRFFDLKFAKEQIYNNVIKVLKKFKLEEYKQEIDVNFFFPHFNLI